MNVKTRVVCAAMLMDDGEIVSGVRHFSPDMRRTLSKLYGSRRIKIFGWWLKKPYHLRVVEEGFIDSGGNFLSREDAFETAVSQNQLIRHSGSAGKPTLYSEDLY